MSSELNTLLNQLPETGGRHVAVFDCDGTLIKGDIGEAMFYFQIEHFLFKVSPAQLWPDFPRREELNKLYDGLAAIPQGRVPLDPRFPEFAQMLLSWYFDQLEEGKTDKACSDIVRLWCGFTRSEALKVAEETLEDELASPLSERELGSYTLQRGSRFIAQAMQILSELRARGFDVWTVSGSNQWSVEAVAHRAGFPRNRVIGIDLKEVNAILGPEVQTPVPVYDGKVQALRKRGVTRPLIVLSDSTYDIPLFNYSAHLKILVNSRNHHGDEFFHEGKIHRDDSWMVIDNPILLP